MSTELEQFAVLSETRSFQTRLNIDYVAGHTIGVSYDTLPGNQPNTYGNFLAIWQNDNQIPWSVLPLNKQPIQTNTPSGSANFQKLDITQNSYIIGYSVGTEVSNICATAYIPAESDQASSPNYDYFSTSITIQVVRPTSVAVQYTTPLGYTPETYKNWLGMWESNAASYTTPPKWKTTVSGDPSAGIASFDNVSIVRGGTYTIAYFMGDKQTTMAATVTFTT